MSLVAFSHVEGAENIGVVPWTLSPEGAENLGLEKPHRIQEILQGLREADTHIVKSQTELSDLNKIKRAIQFFEQVHSKEYIEKAITGSGDIKHTILCDPLNDTPHKPGRWTLIVSAFNVLDEAVGFLKNNVDTVTYAVIRPPGHHAGFDFSGGYCLINTAVTASFLLKEKLGAQNISIIDLDHHFGNGTYDLTFRHKWIKYFSIHTVNPEDYPYEMPTSDNHIGFLESPTATEFIYSFKSLLSKAIDADCLVVSLGFDGIKGDPHGRWELDTNVWEEIGEQLGDCAVPVLIVQEGGYSKKNLRHSARKLALGIRNSRRK